MPLPPPIVPEGVRVGSRPASVLEAYLGIQYPVLDHGFLRVVDYMGTDQCIVDAARVSYQKGTKTAQDDQGLINYLMRHWHTTPFEMCEIKLHVKLPIFVARQWIRHRTASVNEMSARYSILDGEFYIPEAEVLGVQSKTNKQGRESMMLEAHDSNEVLQKIMDMSDEAYASYEELLARNLSRELSRMVLPVNIYTQWYWKTDLHNLFHFLRLRMDPHAQHEIKVYADLIGDLVALWVPKAWSAFENYRLNSIDFSRLEQRVLAMMLFNNGRDLDQDFGMSKGEIKEFNTKVNSLFQRYGQEKAK